jgi:hypothetical protein
MAVRMLLIVAGVVLAILVAGYAQQLLTGRGSAITSNTSLPPSGTVWFGTRFDPSTFSLSGRSGTARTGTTVAFVGQLSRMVDGSDLTIRLSLDGTPIDTSTPGGDFGDVWGSTFSPIIPGTYKVELVDVGGNVLASGTIVVT